MSAPVTVRRAVLPTERPILESLHRTFLEVHYDALFYDELEHDIGCVSLVALVGDDVVGVATARDRVDDELGWARRQLAYWFGGPRPGYIMTLGVLPAFRGRGIGSSLLRELCLVLGAMGCSEVQLHCLASNVAGRALYTAHGFDVTAALAGFYTFGGQRHDAVSMASRLEPGGLPGAPVRVPPPPHQPGGAPAPHMLNATVVYVPERAQGAPGAPGATEAPDAATPAPRSSDVATINPPNPPAPRAWWLPGLLLSLLWPQRWSDAP